MIFLKLWIKTSPVFLVRSRETKLKTDIIPRKLTIKPMSENMNQDTASKPSMRTKTLKNTLFKN